MSAEDRTSNEATSDPEAARAEATAIQDGDATELDAAELDAAVSAAFEQEIAEARRKADENWDRFLRAEAELANARKAAERARNEALARLRRELLTRFLEIADNLDRASAFKEADREALLEGLDSIRREVARVFEREGVSRIEAEAAAFDPQVHDALGVVPMPGLESEQVVQVERAGYLLDGELLRPARVVVGRPPD
ncbi:MAG: nucleotide exchange factor GrpE [Caldilineae bacterium]|nr:nucleotide exchange factor GrpE [Chloroflexota bacterium]MCB9175992.1 nucleotide exchange factor GrpE [Caldilineae bacterium]